MYVPGYPGELSTAPARMWISVRVARIHGPFTCYIQAIFIPRARRLVEISFTFLFSHIRTRYITVGLRARQKDELLGEQRRWRRCNYHVNSFG